MYSTDNNQYFINYQISIPWLRRFPSLRLQKKQGHACDGRNANAGGLRHEFQTLVRMAAELYTGTVGKGVAYHFFVDYARIDCNFSDELCGISKKCHLKAYGDLMYLLTERKSLVEQYFCVPVSDLAFEQLCDSLYHEGGSSLMEPEVNAVEHHLPYSLGCSFTDKAMNALYHCFVAHEVFNDLTEEKVKALFDGSLSTTVKCRWSVRFGYIMHHLSMAGLITNQYQKAIGRCGYIIAPGNDSPMTAECMKEAVKRAKVYSGEDNVPWKRTVNSELNRVFELMGVDERLWLRKKS